MIAFFETILHYILVIIANIIAWALCIGLIGFIIKSIKDVTTGWK